MVSAIEPNWRLIASKNHELFKKREVFLKHINLIGSEIIRCPCGIKATEGSMVSCHDSLCQIEARIFQMLCDCCDEWHHAHCYALDTRNSGFLGEAHACYSCLLGPSESDTHVKLEDVARLRRICWIVQSAGLSIMDKDLVKRSSEKVSRYPLTAY